MKAFYLILFLFLLLHSVKPQTTSDYIQSIDAPDTVSSQIQLTLTGGKHKSRAITVDDDLTVYLNDSVIFIDDDMLAHDVGPVVFHANIGDQIRIKATNTYEPCSWLSPLYLFNENSEYLILDSIGFPNDCNSLYGSGEVFYDSTFIITPNFLPNPYKDKSVRVVYLVPQDKSENQNYTQKIEAAIKNLQIWYNTQMNGNTFYLNNTIVEVISTYHESQWYATNYNGNGAYQFWYNVYDDALALTGAGFNHPNFTWIVYIDADPGSGQQGGAGSTGICILPADDLRGLDGQNSTQPCRWVGGLGHELGHAFGLPHPPGCDQGSSNCDYGSIMWTGFYSYPNCYLGTEEKNILNSGSFFSNNQSITPMPDCNVLTTNVEEENKIPKEFLLLQNFPNPFNPTTKINYSIPKTTFITLKVYDVLGKEITTLVNKEKPAGKFEVEFNGENLSSGIYIYQLRTSDFISTKKMLLIK